VVPARLARSAMHLRRRARDGGGIARAGAVVTRNELIKRLARLEVAAAPPPRFYWSIWQKVLTTEEHAVVESLACRGATHGGAPSAVHTWRDDPESWATLCADGRHLSALADFQASLWASQHRAGASGAALLTAQLFLSNAGHHCPIF
jgi:hypothetical protein